MPRALDLLWTELHLPAPLEAEAARQAVQALATIPGSPQLVLEARGKRGAVRWYLGCRPAERAMVLQALQPSVSGLRTSPGHSGSTAPTAGAAVRLRGQGRSSLAVDQITATSRATLAALAMARGAEQVRLTALLGSRHRPQSAGDRGPVQARTTLHYGQYRFSCALRISAAAGSPGRARELIEAVMAGLRHLEAPGLVFILRPLPGRATRRLTVPCFWPTRLSVSELSAVLGWPIGKAGSQLPGVRPLHPLLVAPSPAVGKRGRVFGMSLAAPQRPVAIGIEDSLRHLHVLGPSGVGKSVLLAQLALQDIAAGRGVVVIDPKGDLVTDILARIPAVRRDAVVLIDPADPAPAGVAAFAGDPEHAADLLLTVFRSLYKDALGPRSSDVLHAGLLTLARSGRANLAALPLLLGNPVFRRTLVSQVGPADPLGLGAFWAWFESLSDPERNQVVAPLRNKLDPLLSFRPGLRAVFGQSSPKVNLAEVLARRQVLLVSLASGVLGPEAATLLGSVLLALIWQTALARVRLPATQRHPVMVYADEMQTIVRLTDLGSALAVARGLGVGFTLAHQSLSQLPPDTREAVMANARSRICFQLAPGDARSIATTARGQLAPEDFGELPAFQAYGWLLSGGSRTPWFSLATQPLGEPTGDPESIRQAVRQRYGRPVAEVERELLELAGHSASGDESFGRVRRRSRGDRT